MLGSAVAQLVERSLPASEEVGGSNPAIGELLFIEHLFDINCIKKTKKKKKDARYSLF